MSASISTLGVILAAASAFPIGSVWYSPAGFLKPWQKMTGTSDADMKKNFGPAMGYIAVASLLTAYIMAHFIQYAEAYNGTSGITAGVETALWLWLGLGVTTTIVNGAFESRSPMVMVIQAGNRLVTFVVMGLILGAFM